MELENRLLHEKFSKIIENLKDSATTPEEFIMLGFAYYGIGKKNQAVLNFRRALRYNPMNPIAHSNLAEIFLQLHDFSNAKKHAIKLLQRNGRDWIAHNVMASVSIFEGFYNKARSHLEFVMKFAPHDIKKAAQEKLEWLLERMEKAEKQRKLAFICTKGLDNFIDDIIQGLHEEFWIQRHAVTNTSEIKSAVDWADIVWLEWANETAVTATNHEGIKGKKVILRIHGYEVFTEIPSRINWNHVNQVVFVANHKRELFFERFGKVINPEHAKVIRNGINVARFKIPENKTRNNKMAFVANLNYRKGLDILVLFFYELLRKNPEYTLYIRGKWQDPRYKLAIEHIIKELNLESNIVFESEYIADLNEWFADKTFVISSSLEESFHYSVGEGMAAGLKPVIFAWKEAREIWPDKYIFRNSEEFLNIVTSEDYKPDEYRNYILQHHTLEKQLERIRNLLYTL